jgi:hypothetical protein
LTPRDFGVVALVFGVAAVAGVEVAAPFAGTIHTWGVALAVTVAGAYLLFVGVSWMITRRANGQIALAATGGALLAACVAFAAFLIGQPERVPAAPGQTYRPPHGSGVAIAFPDVPIGSATPAAAMSWPDGVSIESASGKMDARSGDTVRTGAFVFRVASGPIAYVDARAPGDKPVTVTQPDGPAFLSPFLTFAGLDGDQPEDYFAVPALHRTVQVDYWPGLPSRGIDVPFLALRIAEENGGSLYEGVAVSGRALRKAGIVLTFSIGTYPIVTASSAPPLVPFWAGIAMVLAGFASALSSTIAGRSRAQK